jgi:hypothetical protein
VYMTVASYQNKTYIINLIPTSLFAHLSEHAFYGTYQTS